MPMLREIAKTMDTNSCLVKHLPHKYYEEDNLHGILISGMRDYHQTITLLDAFLPYVDNWSTCDLIAPRSFKKRPDGLIDKVREWVDSGQTYTIRFGIGVLLRYYLDDGFLPEYREIVASIRSAEYYVNMMIAWFFATALAKQYDVAVMYLRKGKIRCLDT